MGRRGWEWKENIESRKRNGNKEVREWELGKGLGERKGFGQEKKVGLS